MAPGPAQSFCAFSRLVVQDTQIRTLVGEDALSAQEIERRAHNAVQTFLLLSQRLDATPGSVDAADIAGRSARTDS